MNFLTTIVSSFYTLLLWYKNVNNLITLFLFLGKVVIPETSFSVKVTNVKNPYYIRIYETKNYIKKSSLITTKLVKYMKKEKLNSKNNNELNLGDVS